MATTLEIIQGLAQAASRAYDGSHIADYNDDGRERSAGLTREEGNPIIDSRVIDGFKVRFSGPLLIITYQSDIKLKQVYAGGFEDEIARRINEIKKFLQKEYKAITGNTVSLTKHGELSVMVQSTSRIRSWVQANCSYKIGGVNAEGVREDQETSVREVTKKFLEQAKAKKPRNITRK